MRLGPTVMRPIHFIRVVVSITCVSALAIGFYAAAPHDFLNSDGILFSIMSLRRVTPFYWGQDRYLNVVPALWSWIRNPMLNLQLCLATFALGLALLVWRGSYWLSLRSGVPRFFAFAWVAWLAGALFSSHAVWVFGVSCQPYAWSIWLIMWAAHVQWLQPRVSWLRLLLVVALLMLAMGINPSAVVLVPVLFVLLPRARRIESLIITGIAAGAMLSMQTWGALSLGASGDYIGLNLASPWQALVDAALGLRTAFDHTRLMVLLAAVGLSVVWGLHRRWVWRVWRLPLILALVAGGWLVVFAHNGWVVASGSPYRYFYPTCFLLPFAGLLMVTQAASRNLALSAALTVACMADVAPNLAVPTRPLQEYPVLQNAARHVAAAPRDQALILVGDYWRVWPALLMCVAEDRSCAAQTLRSGADSPSAVLEVVRAAETRASAVCFDLTAAECTTQLRYLLPWSVSYQAKKQVERRVLVLTLAPRPK